MYLNYTIIYLYGLKDGSKTEKYKKKVDLQ